MTDLDIALAAVAAGSAVTAAWRGRPLEHTRKEGADFATNVDTDAERAIVDVIRSARPDDAIQGEEFGLAGPSGAARLWLVDPLCGTLNFASGSPSYGINVALTQGDDVLAGAVSEPAAGVVYCTNGHEAWCLRGGEAEPLCPSAGSRLVEVHLDTHDPDNQGFSSTRYLRSSTFDDLAARYLGTGLPLVWVASGQRAGFVIADRRGKSVHFAAGIGICRGAGCVCTNLRGERLRLHDDGIVIAADEATHRLLMAGITEQFG